MPWSKTTEINYKYTIYGHFKNILVYRNYYPLKIIDLEIADHSVHSLKKDIICINSLFCYTCTQTILFYSVRWKKQIKLISNLKKKVAIALTNPYLCPCCALKHQNKLNESKLTTVALSLKRIALNWNKRKLLKPRMLSPIVNK